MPSDRPRIRPDLCKTKVTNCSADKTTTRKEQKRRFRKSVKILGIVNRCLNMNKIEQKVGVAWGHLPFATMVLLTAMTWEPSLSTVGNGIRIVNGLRREHLKY